MSIAHRVRPPKSEEITGRDRSFNKPGTSCRRRRSNSCARTLVRYADILSGMLRHFGWRSGTGFLECEPSSRRCSIFWKPSCSRSNSRSETLHIYTITLQTLPRSSGCWLPDSCGFLGV